VVGKARGDPVGREVAYFAALIRDTGRITKLADLDLASAHPLGNRGATGTTDSLLTSSRGDTQPPNWVRFSNSPEFDKFDISTSFNEE
jgi:hypothetical protein